MLDLRPSRGQAPLDDPTRNTAQVAIGQTWTILTARTSPDSGESYHLTPHSMWDFRLWVPLPLRPKIAAGTEGTCPVYRKARSLSWWQRHLLP